MMCKGGLGLKMASCFDKNITITNIYLQYCSRKGPSKYWSDAYAPMKFGCPTTKTKKYPHMEKIF